MPPLKLLPRAPRSFESAFSSTPPRPASHTHTLYDASLYPPFNAGKMAAIEERVENMSHEDAQAARKKDAENKVKAGAYGLQ